MTRPLRIDFPGGIYHVTSRGDRKEPIFTDDRDRHLLIEVLAQALDRFDAAALAYCLMGNHYHLVLRTNRANLSRLMRHVNGVYAQAFNRRHGLVGHLFQGRFGSIHVDRDAYLLQVCRYTELNPVRAGLVEAPAAWRWSSHRAHCGLERSPSWLDTPGLHGHLLGRDIASPADRQMAASRYARFVFEGRGMPLWTHGLRQSVYLGDSAFVERIQARVGPARLREREIPFAQRCAAVRTSRSLDLGGSRDESIRQVYAEGALNMTEIARAVGLSVSRISRVIACGEVTRHPLEGRRTIPVLRARRREQAKGKT